MLLPSRISDAGYGRCFHNGNARLFMDEAKGGSVPSEVASAVESSDTNGDTKEEDLKPDIHEWFEGSETREGSSEAGKNSIESAQEKDAPIERGSLKDGKGESQHPETLQVNMAADLEENGET